jgi:hypothetical protein
VSRAILISSFSIICHFISYAFVMHPSSELVLGKFDQFFFCIILNAVI